jgi:RNA polymerase sigma-B factor
MRKYRDTGDRRMRNEAVEALMPLVDMLARRYRRREASFDDLRQVALLAVVRAADRFDADRGIHFSTFASRTIEGELKRYHRDKTWIVRPARPLQELFLKLRRVEEELAQSTGRSPSVHELAAALGESVDHVLEALQASAVRARTSLDDSPVRDGSDTPPATTRSVAQVDGGYEQVERSLVLDQVLAKLPGREQAILRMRFYENRSQQDIADQLGITQSYLSRLLRQSLVDVGARLDGAMAAADVARSRASRDAVA